MNSNSRRVGKGVGCINGKGKGKGDGKRKSWDKGKD